MNRDVNRKESNFDHIGPPHLAVRGKGAVTIEGKLSYEDASLNEGCTIGSEFNLPSFLPLVSVLSVGMVLAAPKRRSPD